MAGLARLDNFYLGSVLKGLVPAGLRLAYLASLHPGYDQRDTLRYHQALLEALRGRDADRVCELVQAFHRREQKLALGCSAPGCASLTGRCCGPGWWRGYWRGHRDRVRVGQAVGAASASV